MVNSTANPISIIIIEPGSGCSKLTLELHFRQAGKTDTIIGLNVETDVTGESVQGENFTGETFTYRSLQIKTGNGVVDIAITGAFNHDVV